MNTLRRTRLCGLALLLLAAFSMAACSGGDASSSDAGGAASGAQRAPTPTLAVKSPKTVDQVPHITCEELKTLIDGNADLLVVDLQPAEAYELEHIPGAINFPWEEQIPDPSKILPKSKLLLVYCGCVHEENSLDIAGQLLKRGYSKVMVLDGGWLRWLELGYPKEGTGS